MCKKIFAVILMITVLLSSFSVASLAAENVTFSLPDEKVYAGEEFTVSLSVSGSSKISGAVIDISYDKNALEFISADFGSILNENANKNIKNIDGEKAFVRFTYLDPSSSLTASGVILKLRFKARDNAAGDTFLKLSVPNAGDLVTGDLVRLSYKAVGGKLNIINTAAPVTEPQSSVPETESRSEEGSIPEESAITTSESSDTDEATDGEKNKSIVFPIVMLVSGAAIVAVGIYFVVRHKKKK